MLPVLFGSLSFVKLKNVKLINVNFISPFDKNELI